jgi:hypothetical protein
LRKSYIATIVIPEDYEVVELPENTTMMLTENTLYRLITQVETNTVQLMLTMVRDDYEIAPEHYHYLREFYSTYADLYNQQIVLRKSMPADGEAAGSR